MKQFLRWQRILILTLLSLSVFAPIFFVSNRLKSITPVGRREFIEELSNARYRTNDLRLNVIKQEDEEGLKGPRLILYEDGKSSAVVRDNSSHESSGVTQSKEKEKEKTVGENNHVNRKEQVTVSQQTKRSSDAKEKFVPTIKQVVNKKESRPSLSKGEKNTRVQPDRATDLKIKEIRDKIVQAKAYLNFELPGSNSVVKELRARMKELERAVADVTKDRDLSKGALHRLKNMEAVLYKASRVFNNCPAQATKLRAMTYNIEQQVLAQKNEAAYLMQLAARTTPKGLHCLSMRLTSEYFALDSEKRQMSNQQNYNDPNLNHYVVFSDNVMASAVVVNSTISSSKEPEKIVFHVVTDSLNYPAITMWFLLNPLRSKATIQIQNIDDLNVLPSDYDQLLMKQNSSDPRFVSALNHARFYLPDIFPGLKKMILFDHDVVVQRDLSKLWSIDMKGKVIGAVETCTEDDPSFRAMETYINFSDSWISKNFNPQACTWAFGMNVVDLEEWRRQKLTSTYVKYFNLGIKRPLWKAGSLPIGWLTFYKQTIALEKKWHVMGLGHDSGVKRGDIEEAAVIHYEGIMKPWLDIGVINKYKRYWNMHVPYHHSYLQRCNIHA